MSDALITLEAAVMVTRTAQLTTTALADAVALLMQRFEEEHAELLAALAAAREAQRQTEQELRTIALQQYTAHPEQGKQLCPGISIRETSVLTYNEEQALAWARKHSTAMVILPEHLDRSAFEKLAKIFPIPCVEYSTKVQALLAKQL